ncbi:MarR family transcriptional regulator [Actinoplanes subtropicus]|uniref:MarR family transcriptional regulator n=1 Tax=Actinoplanes subtropicus TaxID=543632 RepID=UPI0004C36615|nr:MarR family transcriptional regulator [Actinoplanes subtropicus]
MSFKSTVQRRLANRVKDALRDVSLQLALLNHQVGARLKLRDVDFDCLNLLNQHGPLGPGALAKLAGLHPATMTGVLDRLEKAGWATRDRDREDRRAVVVRAAPERGREIFELYAGMNGSMDDICADYTVEQLEIIEEFLRRTAAAGHDSTVKLTD